MNEKFLSTLNLNKKQEIALDCYCRINTILLPLYISKCCTYIALGPISLFKYGENSPDMTFFIAQGDVSIYINLLNVAFLLYFASFLYVRNLSIRLKTTVNKLAFRAMASLLTYFYFFRKFFW